MMKSQRRVRSWRQPTFNKINFLVESLKKLQLAIFHEAMNGFIELAIKSMDMLCGITESNSNLSRSESQEIIEVTDWYARRARNNVLVTLSIMTLGNMNFDGKDTSSLLQRKKTATFVTTIFQQDTIISVVRLMDALNKLAMDDENSKSIVQSVILEEVSKLCESTNGNTRQKANNLIETLSLTKDNMDILLKKGLIKTESNHPYLLVSNVKNAVKQWKNAIERRKQSLITEGHVMISYQHEYEATATDIQKHLEENNFRTWIDIRDMHGNIYDGMAEAIDGAFAVVVLLSQSYQNSPNCKLEATYTQLSRTVEFIPIKVERNFNPKGWLKMLIGATSYINYFEDQSHSYMRLGLNTIIQRLNNQPRLSRRNRKIRPQPMKHRRH